MNTYLQEIVIEQWITGYKIIVKHILVWYEFCGNASFQARRSIIQSYFNKGSTIWDWNVGIHM